MKRNRMAGSRARRFSVAAARRGRAVAVAAAITVTAMAPLAWAGGNRVKVERVAKGSAQFSESRNVLTIRAADRTVINYRSFDVARDGVVRFVQPSADSRVLNRVNSAVPSRIDGTIQANGAVYFVNPAGVTFGPNSVLNVGKIYAAAGNISDNDFINGINRFQLTGQLDNQGRIVASEASLLGQQVVNSGNIEANMVVMAAGRDVLVGPRDGQVFVKLDSPDAVQPTISRQAAQKAAVNVLGAGDLYSSAVFQRGSIKSKNVTLQSGKGGLTELSGSVDASSKSPAGKGGVVQVLGDTVKLTGASINASAPAGGGNVFIGGDFRGAGLMPTASYTTLSADSTVQANARAKGDGGTVAIWAEQLTDFAGFVSARGGPQAGNGGMVEVSGKQQLRMIGNVDTFAPAGRAGSLLLDPDALTLIDADATPGGTQDPSLTDGKINANDPNNGANTLSWGKIDSLANTTNILIEATGLVTIADVTGAAGGNITSDDLVKLDLTSGSLSVKSTGGSIHFADVNDMIRTEGGPVTFTAAVAAMLGGFNTAGADGSKSGGEVTLSAGTGALSMKSVTTKDADVTISGSSVMLGKSDDPPPSERPPAAILITSGTGTVNITSTSGDISFARPVDSIQTNGGSIMITARGSATLSGLDTTGAGKPGGKVTLTGGSVDVRSIKTKEADIALIASGAGKLGILGPISTDKGNITFSTGSNGEVSREPAGRINTVDGSIAITADTIGLGGTQNAIAGKELILQPASNGRAMSIGEGISPPTGVIINANNFKTFKAGFSNVTFGRQNGSGRTAIGEVTFADPTILRQGGDGGQIDVVGTVTAAKALSFSTGKPSGTSGGFVAFGADVTANDSLTINGDAVLTVTTNLTVLANPKPVKLLGSVQGAHGLEVNGNVTFGAAADDTVTGLTSLVVNGTTTFVGQTLQTTGNQTYGSTVTAPAANLTLTATDPTAQITLTGAVSGMTSVTANASQININSGVSGATQKYQGKVVLAGGKSVTGPSITFADGAGASKLILTGANDQTPVSLTAGTATTITPSNNLVTVSTPTGQQAYKNGTLKLNVNATLEGGSLTMENANINANDQSLTLDFDSATAIGTDQVKNATSLSVTRATSLSGIVDAPNQTYSGKVTLTADTTLKGSTFSLGGGVEGAFKLEVASVDKPASSISLGGNVTVSDFRVWGATTTTGDIEVRATRVEVGKIDSVGNLSLLPTNTVSSTGTANYLKPDGLLILHGDLTATGKTIRLGEDVKLKDNINADGVPAIASIIGVASSFATGGNIDLKITADQIQMGKGQKFTSIGSLTITAPQTATLGDLNALGKLTIDTPDLQMTKRDRANLLGNEQLLDQDVVQNKENPSEGVDFVATTIEFVTDKRPTLIGGGGSERPAIGSNGVYEGAEVVDARDFGPLERGLLLTLEDPSTPSTELDNFIFLDLRASGRANQNLATALAGAMPQETPTPVQQNSADPAQQKELGQLGIFTKDPALQPEELIDFLVGRALYNDVPKARNPDEGDYKITPNRLYQRVVTNVLTTYREIYWKNPNDPASREPAALAAQQAHIRACLSSAIFQYRKSNSSTTLDVAALRRYIDTRPQCRDAAIYLSRLNTLFNEIHALGLSGAEETVSHLQLLRGIRPRRTAGDAEELDFKQLEALITGTPAQVARRADKQPSYGMRTDMPARP